MGWERVSVTLEQEEGRTLLRCINCVLLLFYQPSTKDLNTLTSLTGHEREEPIFPGNSGFCSELTPIGETQHGLWSIRQSRGLGSSVNNGVLTQNSVSVGPRTPEFSALLFPELQHAEFIRRIQQLEDSPRWSRSLWKVSDCGSTDGGETMELPRSSTQIQRKACTLLGMKTAGRAPETST